MKKIFLLILFSMFFFYGCDFAIDYYDSILVFSANPLTKETLSPKMIQNTFEEGQLINYGFCSKEPFKTGEGRVQIFKKDPNTQLYGFSLAESFDIRLSPEKNYYTGAFTIYSEGYYLMRIFTKNSPTEPIAQQTFWITK